MGIAADLAYRVREPGRVQRVVQVAASSRVGARALSRTLPTLDRAVAHLSRGRTTAAELLAGLPVVWLTTTGRRSGLARRTQLVAVPFRDGLAVLGTNFGQSGTPTWVLNLEAHPRATVTYRDLCVDVVSRPADTTERAAILARAGEVYVGYPTYLQRISGRRVRVFVLERAASS
ncbi:nitroreductase/quinone reductase family protein [Fodinibacter luteus]|uniref:Nitroreductase/quinone reductase family protein n=1 Tax=Fodinibacter luteus TaxID=552064 RepID=A0ABP8KFK8_9MICO